MVTATASHPTSAPLSVSVSFNLTLVLPPLSITVSPTGSIIAALGQPVSATATMT